MNKLFEMRVGSHLYGTNTPTSDEDFVGVFIAELKDYFGLSNVKEVDMSVTSKLENGRNAPDAIDKKMYELRNFFKLCLENNPNIVEMLFVNPENLIYSDHYHALNIFQNRDKFLHQGLRQKFIGYSKGQLHKMTLKPENYDALDKFREFFENDLDASLYKRYISEVQLDEKLCKLGNQFYQIGDLKFNPKVKLEDVYQSVVQRLAKAGSRTEIFLKHGYDTKFGMHCIRLVLEGKELLQTGKIEYPLKNAEMLLDIRQGKYSVKDVVDLATQLTNELDNCESVLPVKPNTKAVESILMDILKENFGVSR